MITNIKHITLIPNGPLFVATKRLGASTLIELVEGLHADRREIRRSFGPEADVRLEIDGHDVSWLEQHFDWSPGTKEEKAKAFLKVVRGGHLADACRMVRAEAAA